MSANDSGVDPPRSDHKFFGKHRWRGKLFSSDEKVPKSEELPGRQVNDVVEFLQTPANRKGSTQQTNVTVPRDEKSPTSRLPPAPVGSNAGPQRIGYPRRKPPRAKGLHVTFESARPEVIGEGGDEAELPSIDVRKSQPPARPSQYGHTPEGTHHPRRPSPPLENGPNRRWSLREVLQKEGNDDDESFRSPPLRRQSTGFHNLEPEDERYTSHREVERQDDFPTRSLAKEDALTSAGADSDSESFAAIYASYTQDSPLSPSIVVEQSAPQLDGGRLTQKEDSEDLKGFSSLKPFPSDFEASFENSLTPIPSPQPITSQAALLSSYDFPSFISEKRPPSQDEAVSRQCQKNATIERSKASAPDRSPTSLPIKSPPVSLRNVAKSLGEDAFNEFLTRVQRFNGIFRLGAVADRSFDGIPFTQWIRAGTWWFLKGRGELESAVRGRPRSSDHIKHASEGDLPTGLKQAYLNLAKACWILMEIVPSHEELKKYGNASMGSLSPIVKSFGDTKFAEMLELHHTIIANMRALTMSMKRNSKMPPHEFEPQGLDSRIWVETPRFASGVLLDDGSAGLGSFPYPVGDTTRRFNYGSMFVDVVLRSSDDSQQGVHVSCVLTILRQRTDRELEVVLASQDGQVSLVIQSDRRAGPTWRDVHWKTDTFRILLRLADGLDLDVQFQEQNFRSLWGIYDYTRKVRKEMESREAEDVVFESTVRCVHYVDSPDAQVFPPDPVRSCDVFLFEKTLTVAEGTGRRRVYNGLRLAVITPPSSRTLSSINQSLGKQTAILLNYVRGEDDGPALLLKNEAAGSTLVITFNDPSSRDHFQTLLDGTLVKEDESCTEAVRLRAMKIGTVEGESPADKGNFLSDWRWQELRIINRRPEFFENRLPKTVLSENLRIWAQCEAGTFVDRVNLGIVLEFSFAV